MDYASITPATPLVGRRLHVYCRRHGYLPVLLLIRHDYGCRWSLRRDGMIAVYRFCFV